MTYDQVKADVLSENHELRRRLQGALQDITALQGTIEALQLALRTREDALAAAQAKLRALVEAAF